MFTDSTPSPPVRVMHVVFALAPGGMEYGVVKIVNGLAPARVTSSICSTRPAFELKALLVPSVRLIECHRRDGNDVRLVGQLYRIFRREKPDIVHTHGWGTLIEGLAAAILARVPVLVHGEHGTLQLKPYQVLAQRWAWNRVDQLLAVSSKLAERIAESTAFPLSRICVIRNGVDLGRFGPGDRGTARHRLDLPADGVLIGTVGRLVAVKDQASLIESLALLRQQGCRAAMTIAGDGPLRADLENRARALGLEDAVRFLGYRRDVGQVLQALDIFALSSTSEGLSNTILEAMASALPVVATRVGGADELVVAGVTGLLVRPSTPPDLASALGRLASDPRERHTMGAAGRQRAQTEFSLEAMLRQYEKLYVSLAAKKQGRVRSNGAIVETA